ncbi:RNA polymerase II transcription elongation factor-domain-containing protein [Roridomyces roridus]|uniref:RNA polymerase II transcription elongation factor-domain-containing protein n=1 Tax=Roridomyces roridus TaxID=1738132 RepID=A0AAD7FU91_9AGAR|nr:RNA polymerase II transcription elongation factor-domain-containing protein [Roridomyces roridus]
MASSSWIPRGRHEVTIGPSLNRALKTRKGAPPPPAKRSGPPEKDFYSFRYNFKPPSVDNTKPGTIELSRNKDATTVAVEHASSQPGESYIYHGNETSAKEFDCVLIYDEETGSYKLEKLESYIVLTYDRKGTISLPPSASSSVTRVEDDATYSLLDADGEPDDGTMPTQFTAVPQEEEEGELEEVVAPPPPPPVKPVRAPPPPKQRAEPVVAPRPTKPIPQRKNTKKVAPPPPLPPALPMHVDDNVEEFPDVTRPSTKRAKRAASPVSFALPGTSNWVPPPAPAPPPQNIKAPPPPASPIAVASDSEDDWDEVPPAPLMISAEDDAPQEIDLQDFAAEMEAEMEEEEEGSEPEDFLADALPQAPEDGPVRPLSMGQLAGFSDDEYSSSDESDDD